MTVLLCVNCNQALSTMKMYLKSPGISNKKSIWKGYIQQIWQYWDKIATGLPCVAVCCSLLPCVAVCCRVLQCVAVCCRVLQCVANCCRVLPCVAASCSVTYFWFCVCVYPRLQMKHDTARICAIKRAAEIEFIQVHGIEKFLDSLSSRLIANTFSRLAKMCIMDMFGVRAQT